MIAKRLVLAAAIITAVPLAARGQTPPPAPPARGAMPPTPQQPGHVPTPGIPAPHAAPAMPGHQAVPSFDHLLFPPELVMQYQRELELTPEQRSVITDAVKSLQNQTVDLQWNLQAEQSTLTEMLNRRPINEQGVVAQVNKLLELEANVKRTHLSALVRIKNALTEKQIQQLMQYRRQHTTPYAREFEYLDHDQYFDIVHQYFARDTAYFSVTQQYFNQAHKY